MVPWKKTLPSHRYKKMTIVEVYRETVTPGFTHFFRNFFLTEKAVLQTFSLLECMFQTCQLFQIFQVFQIRFPVKDFFLHILELTAWTAESEFKINSKKNSTKKNQCFFFLNLFQFLFLQIGITPIIFAMFWFGLESWKALNPTGARTVNKQ